MHLRASTALTALTAALTLVATAPGSAAVPASGGATSAGEPELRITGELLVTADEPGHPSQSAVQVGDRLVPVRTGQLGPEDAGSEVTLDLAVPDEVETAAASSTTLQVPDGQGTVDQHQLDADDLDDAGDGSPVDESSPVGAASIDRALAPDGEPLVVSEVVAVTPAPAPADAAATSTTTRRLTLVNVTPKGARSSVVSTSVLQRTVDAAAAFWQDASGGRLRVETASIERHISSRYGCEDYFSMWTDVAKQLKWSPRDGASLALVLPRGAACSHGMGTIGTSLSAHGYLYISGAITDALSHEIGHNISLEHAEALVCSGRSDAEHRSGRLWASGCEQVEYGDGQDVMGIDDLDSPSALLSVPQALRTGMLPGWTVKDVGAGTSTVGLRPLGGLAGQRGARITDALTGERYYVEYRAPVGRDRANAWGQRSGVRVLRVNPDTGETLQLDPSPTGRGEVGDTDHALAEGSSVRSVAGGLKITAVTVTPSLATVRIENSAATRTFTPGAAPRVTGSRGVGRTLTADSGSWSPSPTRTTYVWKRNGIVIPGATGRTYTPTTKDAGRYLSVAVTVRRLGYRDATRTSARVGIPIYTAGRPRVVGTPRAGSTLTVMVGSWTPRPTSFTYQWYRGSTPINQARGKTYRVRSADAGHRLRVKVTARRSGYSSGQAWTASTATVSR